MQESQRAPVAHVNAYLQSSQANGTVARDATNNCRPLDSDRVVGQRVSGHVGVDVEILDHSMGEDPRPGTEGTGIVMAD